MGGGGKEEKRGGGRFTRCPMVWTTSMGRLLRSLSRYVHYHSYPPSLCPSPSHAPPEPKKAVTQCHPPPPCLPFSCPPYHDALGEGEDLLTVHLGHGLFEIRHEGVPLALRGGGREDGRTGGREAAG
jgi:hypothetical protein